MRNLVPLSKSEMKKLTGGVEQGSAEKCVIYTITTYEDGSQRRMQYYEAVDSSKKEESARNLFAATGNHAYWDCDGDGYQHTYYVS